MNIRKEAESMKFRRQLEN